MGLFRDSWQTLDKRIKPVVVLLPLAMWVGSAFFSLSLLLWLIVGLLLSIVVLLYLIHDHRHRQLPVIAEREYHQFEALMGIYQRFEGKLAMTGLRGYAASPDVLFRLLELLDTHRPMVIAELGSGSSTKLISAYADKIGLDCQFYSIEHDQKYLDETASRVVAGKVNFCHCPLIDYQLNGQNFSWYNLEAFKPNAPIDLLLVDGPPVYLNERARYPALPLLLDRLSEHAIIVLDDAARPDEQQIIRQWMTMDTFTQVDIQAEKGLTILYRNKI